MQPGLTEQQILAVAGLARISPAPLIAAAPRLRRLIDAGSDRDAEMLVRSCCPAQPWDWPEAAAHLAKTNRTATQIALAQLVCQRLTHLHYLTQRIDQMRALTRRRPYWALRPVKDPMTPADCLAMEGRVLRHEDPFWLNNGPLHCKHVVCRCGIRSLSEIELNQGEKS